MIHPIRAGQVVRDERGNVGITTTIADAVSVGVMRVGDSWDVRYRPADLEVIEITGTRSAL